MHIYVCVCVYELLCIYVTYILRVWVMFAKVMLFMCSVMKFMCFRGGSWWDSWYKAAKDKVFILCLN